MNDLISIVVITYKRPVTVLKRAIDSARSQDYQNIEIIVVNDCPEDKNGSLAINDLIESYNDPRLIVIHHLTNRGANAARNTGLNIAKGTFISFLDDDDEWYPNKISKQYDSIIKSEKYGIAYSGFNRIVNGKYFPYHPDNLKPNETCLKKILEDNFVGPTSFSLIRMEAIKAVGGFDENIKICQEYELWIRILNNYDSICVDELLGNYYFSVDSTFKNVDKYLNGCNILIDKHHNLYKEYPKILSDKKLNMFVYALKNYRFKEAYKCKIDAFKAYPRNINNFILILFIKKIFNVL